MDESKPARRVILGHYSRGKHGLTAALASLAMTHVIAATTAAPPAYEVLQEAPHKRASAEPTPRQQRQLTKKAQRKREKKLRQQQRRDELNKVHNDAGST